MHAQDRVRADLKLEVGQMAESISITAEAPLLQSETSSLAKVVEQNEIRASAAQQPELPAAGLAERRRHARHGRAATATAASMRTASR